MQIDLEATITAARRRRELAERARAAAIAADQAEARDRLRRELDEYFTVEIVNALGMVAVTEYGHPYGRFDFRGHRYSLYERMDRGWNLTRLDPRDDDDDRRRPSAVLSTNYHDQAANVDELLIALDDLAGCPELPPRPWPAPAAPPAPSPSLAEQLADLIRQIVRAELENAGAD